jgi:hypothetical protein
MESGFLPIYYCMVLTLAATAIAPAYTKVLAGFADQGTPKTMQEKRHADKRLAPPQALDVDVDCVN